MTGTVVLPFYDQDLELRCRGASEITSKILGLCVRSVRCHMKISLLLLNQGTDLDVFSRKALREMVTLT